MSDLFIFILAINLAFAYGFALVLYIEGHYGWRDKPFIRYFLIFSLFIALFGHWILENLIASVLIGAVFAIYYQLNRIMLIADSIRAVLEEDRRRRYKISDKDINIYSGAKTDHEVMVIKNRKKDNERMKARQEKLDRMRESEDWSLFYDYAVRGFWTLLVSVPLFPLCYSVLSEVTFWEAYELAIGFVASLFE